MADENNRATASLPPAAYRRLAHLAQLLGVKPGTELGRLAEEWLFSDAYDDRLRRAEEDAKRFGKTEGQQMKPES